MPKIVIILFLFLSVFCSCKKTDTTYPVLTLQGANPHIVIFASDTAYADPGAVATDDMDGKLTVSSTGIVNMFFAGNYTINYTAADNSGNNVDATRKVIVDAGPYLSGNFSIENFISVSSDSIYYDTISAPDTTTNIIYFKKFARIDRATVYAEISGITITIPSQTINCGNPVESKVFSGYGTFLNDTVFTIYYTVSNSNTEYSGYGVYTRN